MINTQHQHGHVILTINTLLVNGRTFIEYYFVYLEGLELVLLSIVGIFTERYDMSIAHGNIDTQTTRKNHRKFVSAGCHPYVEWH